MRLSVIRNVCCGRISVSGIYVFLPGCPIFTFILALHDQFELFSFSLHFGFQNPPKLKEIDCTTAFG